MEAPPAWANPAGQNNSNNSGSPAAAAGANANYNKAAVHADQHEQELFAKYSTLDEPVLTTIMRDVMAVSAKLRIVLQPLDYSSTNLIMSSYSAVATTSHTDNTTTGGGSAAEETAAAAEQILSENDKMVLKQLKDWDLWGPLVVCLALAVILSFKAPPNQAALTFAAVFSAVWAGGTVVTVNAQLLGGTISFFQSLCVLGYSVFPLMLAALVLGALKLVVRRTWLWLDLIVTGVGCVWALRVSSVFISLYVKPERRALALYPVVFFYTFLAWLILLF